MLGQALNQGDLHTSQILLQFVLEHGKIINVGITVFQIKKVIQYSKLLNYLKRQSNIYLTEKEKDLHQP